MRIRDARDTAGIDRSDADILLAALLRKDRAWLHAHEDDPLPADALASWRQWTERRRRNEPIAYITGEREFYGRPFAVDRRVLIPRPSTEVLVDMALAFLRRPADAERELEPGILGIARILQPIEQPITTVVDVGTGSGCIAVTLALERPDLQVIATDLSTDALDVALENARRHGVAHRIDFRQGNLLEPLGDIAEPFVIVSNPPYIPDEESLAPEVADYEPASALRGGRDGGELLRGLIQHCGAGSCSGLVMECAAGHRFLLD